MSGEPRRARWALIWAVAVVVGGVALYVLRLDPTLWCAVGDRQLRAGNLVQAERAYQRALAIDVDHGGALYGLGWAYLRAGLGQPARERFQRAVDFAPDHFGGYRGLAALDAAQGELHAAEEKLRFSYELAPGEPAILADLAGLYVDAGYPDHGYDLYHRAIDLAPDRPEFRFSLAEACVTTGQLDCALEMLDEAGRLEVREERFAAAVDELTLRATLLEIDMALAVGPPTREVCEEVRGLLSTAQIHLDAAVEEGLDERVAAADRRRLEDARTRVAQQCAAISR